MHNEKQRNGIKFFIIRLRQYIIYRESNFLRVKNEKYVRKRKKSLKNFETETNLKKNKTGTHTN